MEGLLVKNQLNLLYTQRRGHITGCNFWNDDTNRHEFQFTDGSAVATGGEYLLVMPEVIGNYKKTIINNTGWTAGHNGNGLPSSIVCVPGTRLYIFLIRRQDETLDVGFDTDLGAANLWADVTCQARRFRRIGYCQIETLDSNNCRAYKCEQMGNFHYVGESYVGINYQVSMSAAFAYVTGNSQYLPNFDCQAIFIPIPPTGGDCNCLVTPRCVAPAAATLMGNYIYNCQYIASSSFRMTAGIQVQNAYMTQSENGFYIGVDNYTGIICGFRILGFIDSRDNYS
jgi:hypothetical protein